MSQRNSNTPYVWAAIVAIGGFLFGFDAVVISGVIGFITPEFGLSDFQIGMVVAAPSFAGIAAAVSVGTLADMFGRKKVLLVLSLLYTITAVWSALAHNFETLVIARAIGGFAFGSLGLAPIYISEIAPAEKRGQLVSFNQFNIVVGFAVAYFANYYILQLSQSGLPWVEAIGMDVYAWRYMLGAGALPAVFWIGALLFVPESPRWLTLQGQIGKARAIFAKLVPADEVETLIDEVRSSAGVATEPLTKRLAALKNPKLRFVLVVGFVLAVAQQITGINAVYFYAPTIFEQSGVGRDAAFAQAAVIGVTNVVVTIIAMLLIDRVGRRPLLLVGILGVTLSMATISYGFHQARYSISDQHLATLSSNPISNIELAPLAAIKNTVFESDREFKQAARSAIGNAAFRKHESAILQQASQLNPTLILLGILGFVASFALSLGPVMWVMLPEIYPNAVRGVAMASVGFANAIVSWGVQQLFPVMLNGLGSAWVFGIYGAFGLLFMVLFWFIIPETKGRSLEELEDELVNNRRAA